MSDLTDRVDALARAASDQRAAVFAALQAADPEQAAFLQALAAAFGKPEAIKIRLDGKTYRRGTFRAAQDFPDFPQRLKRTLALLHRDEDTPDGYARRQ